MNPIRFSIVKLFFVSIIILLYNSPTFSQVDSLSEAIDTFPNINLFKENNPLFWNSNLSTNKLIPLSEKDRITLKKEEVSSVQDFLNNKEIKKALTRNQFNKIKKAITTRLLTNDSTLYNILQKEKLNTIQDFTRLNKTDLKKITGERVDSSSIEEFCKRAKALQRLKQYYVTQQIVTNKNPRTRIIDPDKHSRININDQVFSEGECEECLPDSDIFSPAVYLLYLLDFIENNYGDDLENLPKIEGRFFQSFDDVAIAQNFENENSYVEYTNDVLWNFMWMSTQCRPSGENNDDLNYDVDHSDLDLWEVNPEKYFEFLELFQNDRTEFNRRIDNEYTSNEKWNFFKLKEKDKHFTLFQSDNSIPFPYLVKDLFDAYVNEFGTTTQEVQFARLGNQAFQEEFARKIGLVLQDLEAIDKDPFPNNYMYATVLLLKFRLKEFYRRKLQIIIRNEEISEIADEYEINFFTKLRDDRNLLIKGIIADSVSNISNFPDEFSVDTFDIVLRDLRSMAINCLSPEGNCPENFNSNDVPLYPIKKLFEYYSNYYPDFVQGENPNVFAARKFNHLLNTVRTEHFDELVEAYGGDASRITRSDTLLYAERKLRSRAELEKGIQELAEFIFNIEILESEYKKSFDWHVESRATKDWLAAVRRAEKNFHSELRSNLVRHILDIPENLDHTQCNYFRGDYPQTVQELGDFLFLDLNITEEFRTTPIAFAISRLHTLIQAVELGIARKSIFDKASLYNNPLQNSGSQSTKSIWDNWLKSYGSWHAAMMVSLYPENFLEPKLRRTKSYHFDKHFCGGFPPTNDCFEEGLVSDPSRLLTVLNNYWNDVYNLRNLTPLDAISGTNQETYFLAADNNNKIFYSQLTRNEEWISWRPVNGDGLGGVAGGNKPRVLVSYYGSNPHIYLFQMIKEEVDVPRMENNEEVIPHYVFKPKVAKLKIVENTLRVVHGWKDLVGSTFENLKIPKRSVRGTPEDLVFITTLRRFENNSPYLKFFFGVVDPSIVNGRTVVYHDLVPKLKVWEIKHDIRDDNSTSYNLLNNIPQIYQSKWLEDIFRVQSNQTGTHLVWVKGNMFSNNSIFITWNNNRLPPNNIRPVFNSPKRINNNTDIKYLNIHVNGSNIANQSFLFFSNLSENSLYELSGLSTVTSTGEKIDLPNNLKIKGLPRSRKYLFGYFPRISLLYFEFDRNNLPNNFTIADRKFLTEPNPSEIIKDENTNAANIGELVNGPASIYNKEILLHIPMAIARRLDGLSEPQHERAQKWLNKIINLNNLDEDAIRNHTLFRDLDDNLRYKRIPLITERDPFDPFASAEATKEIFYADIKLKYIDNLLGTADQLFSQDNVESINRARELYELALRILELGTERDTCDSSRLDEINEIKVKLTNLSSLVGNHTINSTLSNNLSNSVINILKKDAPETVKASRINRLMSINNENTYKFKYFLDRQNLSTSVYQSPELDELILSKVDYSDLENVDVNQDFPVLELKPFCIPENPKVKLLRWRIESNLEKIRTNRNFAGIERDLPHYVIPVDPNRILSSIASGNDPNSLSSFSQVPVYRYSFLIERAKYLVSIAEQFENSLLNASVSYDASQFDILKAKQELELERANISLQNLRAEEAFTAIKSAEIQLSRTQVQFNHYDNLIEQGLIGWEHRVLQSQYTAAAAQATSGIFGTIAAFGKNPIEGFASLFGGVANTSSSLASAFQTQASFERREQEWNFQRKLSRVDQKLANSGIESAFDRLNIINQEQNIGELRLQFANDNLEYFYRKETNSLLYEWLKENYRQLHRQQMYMAIATAKTAQRALEFELKTNLDFIGYGYADYIDDENKVYLGADRLLQDINKLEQFRITNNRRKKEVEKTFSLANLVPAAFQEFRETGVLQFETLKESFDRDFPGHYLRLIRDIEISVVALIPQNEGISASLINPGISRVVTGPPFDESSLIYRYPESIALSKGSNENGLFNLRPDDQMLFPFEGSGVATTWILDMPKGANPFDYNSIVDILFTIRYTAEEDRAYRQKVLDDLGIDDYGNIKTQAKRYFSIRNEFPDQWYALFNPQILNGSNYHDPIIEGQYDENRILKPHTLVLDLKQEDFLQNESDKKIKKITIAVQLDNSLQNIEDLSIPFNLGFFPNDRDPREAESLSISDVFKSTQKFNGLKPFGNWIIQLESVPVDLLTEKNGEDCFCPGKLKDILFIIDYEADIHYNR